MAYAHNARKAEFEGPARLYSGALLLLAIAGFLTACGSGSSVAYPSSATSTTTGSATLTWDAVPVASSYRIHYGTDLGGPYPQSVDAGSGTTFTLMGLSNGTKYYFAATSVDSLNIESSLSNEVSKTIP